MLTLSYCIIYCSKKETHSCYLPNLFYFSKKLTENPIFRLFVWNLVWTQLNAHTVHLHLQINQSINTIGCRGCQVSRGCDCLEQQQLPGTFWAWTGSDAGYLAVGWCPTPPEVPAIDRGDLPALLLACAHVCPIHPRGVLSGSCLATWMAREAPGHGGRWGTGWWVVLCAGERCPAGIWHPGQPEEEGRVGAEFPPRIAGQLCALGRAPGCSFQRYWSPPTPWRLHHHERVPHPHSWARNVRLLSGRPSSDHHVAGAGSRTRRWTTRVSSDSGRSSEGAGCPTALGSGDGGGWGQLLCEVCELSNQLHAGGSARSGPIIGVARGEPGQKMRPTGNDSGGGGAVWSGREQQLSPLVFPLVASQQRSQWLETWPTVYWWCSGTRGSAWRLHFDFGLLVNDPMQFGGLLCSIGPSFVAELSSDFFVANNPLLWVLEDMVRAQYSPSFTRLHWSMTSGHAKWAILTL